jgi:hypothetical protein
MIGRFIGAGTAFSISAAAMAGIGFLIALDFVGEDFLLGKIEAIVETPHEDAVEPAKVEELPALDGAKDITFFKDEAIQGLPFKVMTGVRFASPQALALNAVASRWCYITAPGTDGVLRQIDLAEQIGADDPIFEALGGIDERQLALFRMGATDLEALAKSHCRFDFTSPASASGSE